MRSNVESEKKTKVDGFGIFLFYRVTLHKMWSELVFYGLIGGTLLYAFYKWATVNRDYFVKRKIKHLNPNFLIGNTSGLFFKRHTPADYMNSIYFRYPNEKYVF